MICAHNFLHHLPNIFHKLIKTRKILNLTSCLFTDIKDFSSLFNSRTRNSYIYLLNSILLNCFKYTVRTTNYRHSVNIAVPFIRIVINHTIYTFINLLRVFDGTQNNLTRFTCTNNHNTTLK